MSPHINTQTSIALPDFWSLDNYDIVLIPSMTVPFYETKGLSLLHEERHLVMLNLLKNTNCRIIFVISSALDDDIVRYRLGVYERAYNDTSAEKRLVLLDAKDSSSRALTEKILDNENLMAEIRSQIRNPEKTIMLSYICNPLDETLRNKLGIKYWFGSTPSSWGTKSGSRQIFKESGIPIAEGLMHAVRSLPVLEAEILSLENKTRAKRIIVKIDDGAGGYGNVVVDFSSLHGRDANAEDAKQLLHSSVEKLLPFTLFVAQLEMCGVIIEEMIDPSSKNDIQTTPSVQLYISDLNKVQVLSSHEQLMDGCFYLGCRFPADKDYHEVITKYGKAAGEVMSQKGVRGFCGIDFLATKTAGQHEWHIIALEINLRLCATTFAYFSLLTVVEEDQVMSKHYIHLDEVTVSKQFSVPELQRELARYNLAFDWEKGIGCLLTTLSTLRTNQEISVICIGNSVQEVDELHKRFVKEIAATQQRVHGKAEDHNVPRVNQQGEAVQCA